MNLIDAMRSEFGKNKKWHNQALALNAVLVILSILLIFKIKGPWAVILSGCVLIMPILVFVFKEKSLSHQENAENIRRSLMIWDGLEIKPSHLELAQVKAGLGILDKSEPAFIGPYYDSVLSKGAHRLADIITESAFFTKNLSGSLATILLIISATIFVLSFFTLYLLIFSNLSREIDELIAKSIAVLMIYFVSGDTASLWRRYSCLFSSCGQIERKSDALRRSERITVEEVMKVMDDYNCAVIQTPPIPGIIYELNKNRLNEAWKNEKIEV